VAQHLVLRQAHDLTRRDRHAVQAKPLWVDAELAERRVLLAEAEVLARLRRILADPELQRRLLGTRQGAGELAAAAQQRVDPICEVGVGRTRVEYRRDLDPDFARMPLLRVRPRRRGFAFSSCQVRCHRSFLSDSWAYG